MRYNRQDELERMRSRRGRNRDSYEYEEDWEDEYEDEYEDAYEDEEEWEDDLEEVYIDDRSSARGERPVRRTAGGSGRGGGTGRAYSGDSRYHSSGRQHSSGRYSSHDAGRHNSRHDAGRYSSQHDAGRHSSSRSGSRERGDGGQSAYARQKKRAKKKSPFRMARNLVLLLLLCVIGFTAWSFLHRQTGVWTVAIFGVDSRDGGVEKNALADVQMICTIDRATGEIKLTSVFRDTYLKINSDGTYHKINEAYFRGGHEQAVAALEENLDLHIDNYATFNWKSVAEAINVLGGIDLEITDAEFAYINAFITETVNSTGIGSVHLEHAGMQHLDGIQAVAYSRLRLMDTDFQRTERQRKVVSLALEKAKAADVGTLTQLVATILPQLSTNIGVDDLLPMAKNISSYHLGETAGFPFSRQSKVIGRMDCVIPTTLESNVIQLHQFLYGEEDYRPSSAVRTISQKISEDSGLYEEGKPAPTGSGSGSSGNSSSGNSGGSGQSQTEAPAPVPEETTAAETTAEETTTEETIPEETTEESVEEETTEEIGPGAGMDSDRPSQSFGRDEAQEDQESSNRPGGNHQGPGSTGGPGEAHSPGSSGNSVHGQPPSEKESSAGEQPTASAKPEEVGPGV